MSSLEQGGDGFTQTSPNRKYTPFPWPKALWITFGVVTYEVLFCCAEFWRQRNTFGRKIDQDQKTFLGQRTPVAEKAGMVIRNGQIVSEGEARVILSKGQQAPVELQD